MPKKKTAKLTDKQKLQSLTAQLKKASNCYDKMLGMKERYREECIEHAEKIKSMEVDITELESKASRFKRMYKQIGSIKDDMCAVMEFGCYSLLSEGIGRRRPIGANESEEALGKSTKEELFIADVHDRLLIVLNSMSP